MGKRVYIMDDEAAAVALSEVLEIWAAAQITTGVEAAGPGISATSCAS